MMHKKATLPTQQRLSEVFVYCDGELFRKDSKNRLKRVGCESDHAIVVMIDNVLHSVHKIVWILHHGEIPTGLRIHHCNGNRFDNRIENLTLATLADSVRSAGFRKSNTTGFKGVCRHKQSGKWRACIKVNRVQKHLGLFDSKEDAHLAYCQAAIKYHGDFANFGTARRYVRPIRCGLPEPAQAMGALARGGRVTDTSDHQIKQSENLIGSAPVMSEGTSLAVKSSGGCDETKAKSNSLCCCVSSQSPTGFLQAGRGCSVCCISGCIGVAMRNGVWLDEGMVQT